MLVRRLGRSPPLLKLQLLPHERPVFFAYPHLVADLKRLFEPLEPLGQRRYRHADHAVFALEPRAVLELDRRVGEAIDIFVNDRLVARGEVVLVEDRLGVTMTEIIKADR